VQFYIHDGKVVALKISGRDVRGANVMIRRVGESRRE
jgi:hypothetical protein